MREQVDLAEAADYGVDAAWLAEDHVGPLEATDERIARLREFAMERWRERAAERGDGVPEDLTGACNFNVLLVKAVLGGSVRGSYEHHHNLVDGRVVDLSEGAADVRALSDPHRHDPGHFAGNVTLYDQLDSCLPRVSKWAEAFVGLECPNVPAP